MNDLIVRRSAGVWTIGLVGEDRPRPVAIEELLALIGDAEASGQWLVNAHPSTRLSRPTLAGDLIGPVWTIAGVAHQGTLLVEDVHSDMSRLDETDLRILDVLDGPVLAGSVCDALNSIDRTELLARMGQLCAVGRLRLLSNEAASAPVESPTLVPDPDPVASSTMEPSVTIGTSLFGQFSARAAEVGRIAYWSVRDTRPVARVERFTGWCPRLPAARTGVVDPAAVAAMDLLDESPVVADAEIATAPVSPTPHSGTSQDASPDSGGSPGRVPVYAIWHHELGPQLSLGMLTAAARAWEGGRLLDDYEIRRPEDADSFLADLPLRSTPAVLLCSDYLWSLGPNLAAARQAIETNPNLVIVHGGPSCPRYEGDAEAFLDEHGELAHILVRGEGERAICEVLDALSHSGWKVEREAFESIPGLTFRDPDSGDVVRTHDRERSSSLDDFVSPYLTGEFDHLDFTGWVVALETNRGCPYSCTFCDWGSATNSRIRMFDLERTFAEIDWLGRRGVQAVMLTDANFGIMARDVEIAEHIAAVREETGAPTFVVWTPAKNTTKHLLRILEILQDAGIVSTMALSMQTFDPDTLQSIDRSNISSQHFVELAAEFRRRGIPLQADLMLGLPGQSRESFAQDLQIMFDQEILPRVWPVVNLPNAPMNDPAYKVEHGITTDERRVVISTKLISPSDRERMLRLRRLFIILESYGVLRHVLRWLQWDRNIPAMQVMSKILDVVLRYPGRYPRLTLLVQQFDLDAAPPAGWAGLMADVRDFLVAEFDVASEDPGLRTVLQLQEFLLPQPGRTFPASTTLAHDYPAYYQSATRGLARSGVVGQPDRPLADYGYVDFVIDGDPLDLCGEGIHLVGDSREELVHGDIWMMAVTAYELDSCLTRWLPQVARTFPRRSFRRPAIEVIAAQA